LEHRKLADPEMPASIAGVTRIVLWMRQKRVSVRCKSSVLSHFRHHHPCGLLPLVFVQRNIGSQGYLAGRADTLRLASTRTPDGTSAMCGH
jgi:hypothetical protein